MFRAAFARPATPDEIAGSQQLMQDVAALKTLPPDSAEVWKELAHALFQRRNSSSFDRNPMGHHCGRIKEALTRREMLVRTANRLRRAGALALAADPKSAFADQDGTARRPLSGPRPQRDLPLHGRGSVAGRHLRLQADAREHHGENPAQVIGKIEKTQFDSNGTVMRCPWTFRRRGESGLWVSDLFPNIGGCIDGPLHRPARYVQLLGAHGRELLPPHRERIPGRPAWAPG